MHMLTSSRHMQAQAREKRQGSWYRGLLTPVVLSFSCIALVTLSGCGFKVRGFDLGVAFKTISVQGNNEVAQEIRRSLSGRADLAIVEKPTEAEIVLVVASQSLERSVVAFSSAGRPREIQMRAKVIYRITDRFGIELSPPQQISETRDVSVSESEALAMVSAEDFMRGDLNRDIAQQIIRRLRAVKPPTL